MTARLTRIVLNSADPDRLAGFYEAALGFRRVGDPVAGAGRLVGLQLGQERVDLVGLAPGAAPYPGDVPGWSPLFQHFAIIVSDMQAAFARLSAHGGSAAISRGGPQILPESSGGVSAYKFRDPEGHPLELLAFPAGAEPDLWKRSDPADPCLGIDHSAISVADTARSIAFYGTLGCEVGQRSHNVGPEQARLDAIDAPDVEVTGLMLPGQDAPHIELLCYRGRFDRSAAPPGVEAVAATRLVLEMDETGLRAACRTHADRLHSAGPVTQPDGRLGALLRDPDGHLLQLST